MAKTDNKTKTSSEKLMTREDFLASLTLQDIVDVLLVNYPGPIVEPILLLLQNANDLLNLLEKHELLDEAFPETETGADGTIDGEGVQQETSQEVEQTGDAVEAEQGDEQDGEAVVAIDEGEQQEVEQGQQEQEQEQEQQTGQEEVEQQEVEQEDEAAALELTADAGAASAAEAEAAAAQEVEEAPAAKKSRAKAAKATKKKEAAKAAPKKGKKAAAAEPEADEVATEAVVLSKLVTKPELTKAAKAMGDAKPKKVLKALGFAWPKSVKAEPESVALAVSVVAAHAKLSAMPLAKLTALAEKHGVEVKFGNVRKEDAKVAKVASAIIAAALGDM